MRWSDICDIDFWVIMALFQEAFSDNGLSVAHSLYCYGTYNELGRCIDSLYIQPRQYNYLVVLCLGKYSALVAYIAYRHPYHTVVRKRRTFA